MKKYYFGTAEEIVKAESLNDFSVICKGLNFYYWFHPDWDQAKNFCDMLNYITEKGSLDKAKKFLAYLEAGSFYKASIMHYSGFSLPDEENVRVSNRNIYRLKSIAIVQQFYNKADEKITIKVVFDGTKWKLKSVRTEFEIYYFGEFQFRKVNWFKLKEGI